jgi:hypothetical protein
MGFTFAEDWTDCSAMQQAGEKLAVCSRFEGENVNFRFWTGFGSGFRRDGCAMQNSRIGATNGNVRAMTERKTKRKWLGFRQKEAAAVLTCSLNRGMCRSMYQSPLVTSGLCFYNPHITAWKTGMAKGHSGIQPPGEAWQFMGNRPHASALELAAIFLISQEH